MVDVLLIDDEIHFPRDLAEGFHRSWPWHEQTGYGDHPERRYRIRSMRYGEWKK